MTTTTLPALKPCPFCGGTPSVIERPDNIDGTEFFCAVSCYCAGYLACAHKMARRPTPEQAKDEAIAAWNRRASLEAALAVPAQWMDMESAPKDERILLFVPAFGPWNASWWPGSWAWTREQWAIHTPFSGSGDRAIFGTDIPQPTGWMPLPAPPGTAAPSASGDALNAAALVNAVAESIYADAERYRFVRGWWFGNREGNLRKALSPGELDAAIDAQITKEKTPATGSGVASGSQEKRNG
jgi:Lar family restriction alleviation protein